MKFLLISFLLATAYFYSAESATVEELTRRAQQLLQVASNEIRLLREEGRVLSAEGLEREETILLELVVELRAAEVEGRVQAEVRLEEILVAVENRLAEELRRLGREFVTQQEKLEIIRRAQVLLESATAAIVQLRQENKTLLAEGLIRQETILIELEVQLRAAEDPRTIRELEVLLRNAETQIAFELRQLGRGGLKKRDLRDDLINRAKELQARVEAEVKVLKSENRTDAAELIAREEQNILEIVEQLQNATAEADIRALEQRLGFQELRLEEDLRRLGRPVNTEELRARLNAWAEQLIARANEEIKALQQENRTQAVELIQREEQTVTQLVAELKNATQEAEVRRIEEQLGQAEFRLFEELRRQGRPVVNRQQVEMLIRRAEELAVRTTIEIRKLREEGRGLLAEGLEREERFLIELDVELRAATTPAMILTLEQRLAAAEQRIQEQLRQLGRNLKKRDVRDDLIQQARELQSRIDAEVRVLMAANRTQAAELIAREEKNITDIVAQLEKATTGSEIKVLQERLVDQELRLYIDLERLGRLPNGTNLKDFLTRFATELARRASEEIRVLRQQGKTEEVAVIEREEQEITRLVAELKNATLEEDLRKIEEELGNAEFRLYEELAKLGQPVVTRQEIERLIRRAEELAVRATIEIRKLREAGQGLLASGLERAERYLIELDVELRSATTLQQVQNLERRLQELEQTVEQELKQLGGF